MASASVWNYETFGCRQLESIFFNCSGRQLIFHEMNGNYLLSNHSFRGLKFNFFHQLMLLLRKSTSHYCSTRFTAIRIPHLSPLYPGCLAFLKQDNIIQIVQAIVWRKYINWSLLIGRQLSLSLISFAQAQLWLTKRVSMQRSTVRSRISDKKGNSWHRSAKEPVSRRRDVRTDKEAVLCPKGRAVWSKPWRRDKLKV